MVWFGHKMISYRAETAFPARSYPGVTCLHLAARNGHKRCMHLLVDQFKADPRIVDCDGYTAIHSLACNGRTELLAYMLAMCPDGDVADRQGQVVAAHSLRDCARGTSHMQTALHAACRSGHSSTATLLLDRGARIDATDSAGRTPLLLACTYGQSPSIRVLLTRGAALLRDQ